MRRAKEIHRICCLCCSLKIVYTIPFFSWMEASPSFIPNHGGHHPDFQAYGNTSLTIGTGGPHWKVYLWNLEKWSRWSYLQSPVHLLGFLGGSDSKESACDVGDPGLMHLFGELYTAHMAETGKDLLWPAPVSAVGSVSGRWSPVRAGVRKRAGNNLKTNTWCPWLCQLRGHTDREGEGTRWRACCTFLQSQGVTGCHGWRSKYYDTAQVRC